MSNVITAYLGPCPTATTEPRYQYDMGQVLMFAGVSLPAAYQVDFSNNPRTGDSVTQIGTADEGVAIPDMFFLSGKPVYAFIVLTDNDGVTTEYRVEIPVIARPARTDEEPTPEEQTAIDQAIAALNAAVEATGEAQQGAEIAQQAAEAARDAAVAAANGADVQAQQAAQSAQQAAQSAVEAGSAASAAAISASQANDEAANAQSYALAAQRAADAAGDDASAAHTSAQQADDSATEAAASESAASTSASGASASASAAQTAKTAAESAADRAETAVSQLVDISATATTLAPGSAATASYDNGVITLGIPQGAKGDKGDTGDTGPAGSPGPAGVGVPTGGATGQVLAKKSGTAYDTEWVDQSGGGGGTSDYTDLTNKPSINNVTLTGNKSLSDLGAASESAVAAKYTKPSTGIPKSDLASAVQTSLGKADTALQSAPVTSVNGQTGAVTLDAGDVEYDDTDTYASETVGAGIANLKSEIGDLANLTTTAKSNLVAAINEAAQSGGGGGGSTGGTMVVNDSNGVLDKTFQQILDAISDGIMVMIRIGGQTPVGYSYSFYYISNIISATGAPQGDVYRIVSFSADDSMSEYSANSPSDYPHIDE